MGDFSGFVFSVMEQWRKLLTGSLVLALFGFVHGLSKFSVPISVYWLIVCVTLFWAFFGAWREERKARRRAESRLLSEREIELFRAVRGLSVGLLDLMRRFPNSPAVLSPFSMTWRPLIGTTDFGWDVKEMMAWHSKCLLFIDSFVEDFGAEANKQPLVRVISEKVFPDFPPPAWLCLAWFSEIEDFLLRKAVEN